MEGFGRSRASTNDRHRHGGKLRTSTFAVLAVFIVLLRPSFCVRALGLGFKPAQWPASEDHARQQQTRRMSGGGCGNRDIEQAESAPMVSLP
jgi:hypothetical protein